MVGRPHLVGRQRGGGGEERGRAHSTACWQMRFCCSHLPHYPHQTAPYHARLHLTCAGLP